MRRFFRFTVRDLLWLTLVVAVGLGWFVHQRQLRADVGRASKEAETWRTRCYDIAALNRLTHEIEDKIRVLRSDLPLGVKAECPSDPAR